MQEREHHPAATRIATGAKQRPSEAPRSLGRVQPTPCVTSDGAVARTMKRSEDVRGEYGPMRIGPFVVWIRSVVAPPHNGG
jgi:hypothetical protein